MCFHSIILSFKRKSQFSPHFIIWNLSEIKDKIKINYITRKIKYYWWQNKTEVEINEAVCPVTQLLPEFLDETEGIAPVAGFSVHVLGRVLTEKTGADSEDDRTESLQCSSPMICEDCKQLTKMWHMLWVSVYVMVPRLGGTLKYSFNADIPNIFLPFLLFPL